MIVFFKASGSVKKVIPAVADNNTGIVLSKYFKYSFIFEEFFVFNLGHILALIFWSLLSSSRRGGEWGTMGYQY